MTFPFMYSGILGFIESRIQNATQQRADVQVTGGYHAWCVTIEFSCAPPHEYRTMLCTAELRSESPTCIVQEGPMSVRSEGRPSKANNYEVCVTNGSIVSVFSTHVGQTTCIA